MIVPRGSLFPFSSFVVKTFARTPSTHSSNRFSFLKDKNEKKRYGGNYFFTTEEAQSNHPQDDGTQSRPPGPEQLQTRATMYQGDMLKSQTRTTLLHGGRFGRACIIIVLVATFGWVWRRSCLVGSCVIQSILVPHTLQVALSLNWFESC